jgi:hypothetical protein
MRPRSIWKAWTQQSALSRRDVHFLHIGKTGGTEIKRWLTALNEVPAPTRFKLHGHSTTLASIPGGDPYFFSIRDPLERFRSGFYSRKRMGRPRNYVKWSEHEERAFENFQHASELAEDLFKPDSRGESARRAMGAIVHVRNSQADWFLKKGYFLETCPPVYIIRQRFLDEDLTTLLRKLGLEIPKIPPANSVAAHRNPYPDGSELSEKAEVNLRKWYARDIEFVKDCERWLSRQQT